jgi:DNA-binding transcriptional regulator YiaG
MMQAKALAGKITERMQDTATPPMKPSDFRAFVMLCKDSGMSEGDIARLLGSSKNSITKWKQYFAPPYIGLAIAALAAGIPSWTKK